VIYRYVFGTMADSGERVDTAAKSSRPTTYKFVPQLRCMETSVEFPYVIQNFAMQIFSNPDKTLKSIIL
jgi:hypothetical protein